MKPEEQIIEIAKLDGRKWNMKPMGNGLLRLQLSFPPEGIGFVEDIKIYSDRRLATDDEVAEGLRLGLFDGLYDFDYLASRDAIVSVIRKQPYDIQVKTIHHLDCGFFDGWYDQQIVRLMLATASQLAEALLRATNKWKD